MNKERGGGKRLVIGRLVARMRQERGLSLEGLASRSGVDKSTLSRWERGSRTPRGPELEGVLRALRVSDDLRNEALALAGAGGLLIGNVGLRRVLKPPSIGELLQAARWRSGATQLDIADEAQVPRGSLARWERGESWPNSERVERLCASCRAFPEERTAFLRGAVPHWNGAAGADGLQAHVEALGSLDLDSPRAALLLLSTEMRLWPQIGRGAGRERMSQVYRTHARWLLNIGRLSRADVYAERAEILLKG